MEWEDRRTQGWVLKNSILHRLSRREVYKPGKDDQSARKQNLENIYQGILLKANFNYKGVIKSPECWLEVR
jgi:hypothetical protein